MTEKKELVSTGKAKSLFKTSDEDQLMMVYRDDTSAFDGKKTEALKGKGEINNKFNAFVMQHLERNGVETHFFKRVQPNRKSCKKTRYVAGRMCGKKYCYWIIMQKTGC